MSDTEETPRPDVEAALRGAQMALSSSNPFVATQADTIEKLARHILALERRTPEAEKDPDGGAK